MNRPAAGIYLHWPFCERKCPYCDFYTFGREHPYHSLEIEYRQALVREIGSVHDRLDLGGRPTADTVYFGGGTPSLMGVATLEELMQRLGEVFDIAPGAEVTLEVNPTTAESAGLDRFRAAGVNRLSVGSQSFNDRTLERLGRVHDAATTHRALDRMRALGFDNISLDLMFAVPGQTVEDCRRDLDIVLVFAPEHVSAYGLTIHDGTPYARWQREGRLSTPGDDDYVRMYRMLIDRLAEAGYRHYEISNWARPGRESRHNSKYWRDCDVAAFGVSAHGVWARRRYANGRDLKAWIRGEGWAEPVDPPVSERSRLGEIMMLALRRVEGVAWSELEAWAGVDLRDYYRVELERLTDDGLLEPPGDVVRLSTRGLLLADTVMAEFF